MSKMNGARRRALATLGALGAAVAGFPSAAQASPCKQRRVFGDYTVDFNPNGARIMLSKGVQGLTFSAEIAPSGRAPLYIWMQTLKPENFNGRRFDVNFTFKGKDADAKDDGFFTLKATTQTAPKNPRLHLLRFSEADSRRVYRKFLADRTVTVLVTEKFGSLDPTKPGGGFDPNAFVRVGPNMSLRGTRAAARYVQANLRECSGGGGGRSGGASGGGGGAYRPGTGAEAIYCYFSAGCLAMGLADDCVELETLRAHRDGVLARSAHGRALIAEVTAGGGALGAALEDLAPAARAQALRAYYAKTLTPTVILLRLGCARAAERVYARGLLAMLARYAPETLAQRRAGLAAALGGRAAAAAAAETV
ncbi:MAG: hypothetical protein AAFR16_00045 [Pseudomonadota bacterium]